MQGETGDRAGQHRAQMSGQVVLPAVEQVLEAKAGLGLPFDGEASLEEEGVGVLATARKIDEILERPANRDVRRPGRASQPTLGHLERERERHVFDAEPEALASKFIEPVRERLTAQQLIDRQRHHARVQGRGRVAQQAPKEDDRIRHDKLPGKADMHSCHATRQHRLISVNARAPHGAVR